MTRFFLITLTVAAGIAAAPSEAQIAQMNAKVRSAHEPFRAVWTDAFRASGKAYAAPALRPYRTRIQTPCGVAGPGNALYCAAANAIFYEESFLAEQMLAVASSTHGDGDYAPITILAHELGHAADYWLNRAALGAGAAPPEYGREAKADCFAGAITRRAEQMRLLSPGDVQEAWAVLERGGDPTLSGAPSHGSASQRVQNFQQGYQKGAQACDPRVNTALKEPGSGWNWENRTFREMMESRPGELFRKGPREPFELPKPKSK